MFESYIEKKENKNQCEALFEIPKQELPYKHIIKALVDIPNFHLNQLFEYELPEEIFAEKKPKNTSKIKQDHLEENKLRRKNIEFGTPITVPFKGRRINGWIIEKKYTNQYSAKIQKVISINSKYGLLNKQIYKLAIKISENYVTNVSEIVKLAVQNSQVKVENKFKAINPSQIENKIKTCDIPDQALKQYVNGEKLLQALKENIPIKSTFTFKSYYGDEKLNWIYSTILAIITTIKNNKQVIILLPNKKQCDIFYSHIQKYIDNEIIALLHSNDVGSIKYTNYLKVLLGQAQLVIGTQSAIFAPTNNLGLIICVDDANLNYQRQKSPYINIRQVCIQRSIIEKTAIILCGFNKSIHMRQLENLKWAMPVQITPQLARKKSPQMICTELVEEKLISRISSFTIETIKKALTQGPVLIQVGSKGYYSKIICNKCDTIPKCNKCNHILSMQIDYSLTCVNCTKIYSQYECKKCKNTNFKAIQSGDNKTAIELGKMFPSTPILLSNANHPINDFIDDRSRIIVATPGSEPTPINGYEASIILDVDTIYNLPSFFAQLEAFRRWYNIAGLTKEKGKVIIDGHLELKVSTNIQTWNVDKLLDTILFERKQLELPPHTKFISLCGNHHQIVDAIKYVEGKGFETLGIIPKTNNEALTICKAQMKDSKKILNVLKQYMAIRSLKRVPIIKIQVDPMQLW